MMFIENVLVPISLGTLSFMTWNWVLNPVLEFFQLRKEIHVDLIDIANIWSIENPHDEERARTSSEKIRRLSAQMTALKHSLHPSIVGFLPRYILHNLLKMDSESAAKNLMIYHNDFMDQLGLRTKARHEIEKALNLPMTDTPEKVISVIRMAENRMNRVG